MRNVRTNLKLIRDSLSKYKVKYIDYHLLGPMALSNDKMEFILAMIIALRINECNPSH